MKHKPIHEKCKGCHQIEMIGGGAYDFEYICKIYSNPDWIWNERYCPEKTRYYPIDKS